METSERSIREFRVQTGLLLWVKYALALTAGWFFVWGFAVVVLRAVWGFERVDLLLGAAGAIPAMVAAAVVAGRKAPGRAVVRALIDEHNRMGGMYMAASEVELGQWSERVREGQRPRLKWRGGKTGRMFGLAVLFVVGSFLVPQRYVGMMQADPLEVGQEIQELQAEINILEEEKVIEESQARELEAKLEQLREDASGSDPVKTWEALDHLEQKLGDEAQEAAQESLVRTEELTRAEALAEAMAQADSELQGDLLAEAMQELKEAVAKALEGNELLEASLDASMLAKLGAEGLSEADLKKLGQALRMSREDMKRMLERLGEMGMIDAEMLKACEGMCQSDPNALAQYLCMHCAGMCAGDKVGMCAGRGGVNRGRGDAEMTWKNASSEEDAEFQEQVLPPAMLDQVRQSRLVGVSVGAPTVETATGASKGGALAGAAAGGGGAHTGVILPRHKGAVKRYFDRN